MWFQVCSVWVDCQGLRGHKMTHVLAHLTEAFNRCAYIIFGYDAIGYFIQLRGHKTDAHVVSIWREKSRSCLFSHLWEMAES